jgi:hypothetical protein
MSNRGVLIVRPKQAYLEWAAGLDDSKLTPDVQGEQTVYLTASFDDDAEAERVLRNVHSGVSVQACFVDNPAVARCPPQTLRVEHWLGTPLHMLCAWVRFE